MDSVNSILSVVITFVVTLILNSAISYYTSDTGTIGLSKSVSIGGKSILVLTVENYSRNFIEGIAVEVPSAISIDSIQSDSPVTLVDSGAPARSDTRVVRIGQISPRLVTRLFIPLQDPRSEQQIEILNREVLGLKLRKDDELESPLLRALKSGLIMASLYAVFGVAITMYMSREFRRLHGSVDIIKKERAGTMLRVEKLEHRLAKHRLLLLARLSDYSKELSFWRNTFKSLVLQSGAACKRADEVIETVTRSLGTQGAAAISHDFDTIRVAAAWLADAEREDRTQEGPAQT